MKLIISLILMCTTSVVVIAQQRVIINGPGEKQDNVIYPKPNLVDLEQKVNSLVNHYTDLNLFSGVVLVAEKGSPIYYKGFGMANIEQNIPVTTKTVFDIGSMNKAFTESIIYNLVHDGKLKLDDKLGQYLDGFSEIPSKQVTIQHLLDHSSGFQDYHTPEYMQLPERKKTIDAIVDIARKQELLFEPGEGNYYSNVGYTLLGAIIEKVTGKPYNLVVQERIIDKLKLAETYLDNKYNVPNRAIGYESSALGDLKNSDYLQLRPTPAGSFMSTALDLMKFFRAYYYGDKLWSDETRKLNKMKYEFTINAKSNGSAPMIAGGFAGVNSVSFEILRDQISVIVLANRNPPAAMDVGIGVLDIIRGKTPMPVEIPITQEIANAYFKNGSDYVKDNFDKFFENRMIRIPKDAIMNEIGYDLFFADKLEDAANIFKLNTELFPTIANSWDSYGEVLLKMGDKMGALTAYKRALAIQPDLPSSIEAVKKLEVK